MDSDPEVQHLAPLRGAEAGDLARPREKATDQGGVGQTAQGEELEEEGRDRGEAHVRESSRPACQAPRGEGD